jgi:eukaryotic-like serine/threonine-protein kinase
MTFGEGSRLGHFVLHEELGAGGMGVVYRAHDDNLRREVAIKLLLPERAGGEQQQRRFLREARAAAALSHPNIVTVFEIGEHQGQAFIVMELVDGHALRDSIGDDSVPMPRRLAWAHAVAAALSEAHRRGLVHRDVKPENVMITPDARVKVLDFGIAHRTTIDAEADTAHALTATVDEGVAGTPAYMAPEQIKNKPVEASADQFAWGVVVYELLTGKLPWEGSDLLSLTAAIVSQQPERPRAIDRRIPKAVEDTVMRALAKEPDERWPSMAEVMQRLAHYAASTTSNQTLQPTTSYPPPAKPPSARTRRLIAGALALAAAMAVVFLAMSPPAGRSVAAPSASVTASATAAGGVMSLPEPNCSAEATSHYKSGLRAVRDGNYETAHQRFQAAVDADGNCAGAWYRLAMTGRSHLPPSELREVYQTALGFKSDLTPRDRALLDAYEPLIARHPVDRRAFGRRMVALTRRYPNDAEIASKAAFHAGHLTLDERVTIARRATAIDPQHADGYQAVGRMLTLSGRLDDARNAGMDCLDRVPAAADCIKDLTWVEAQLGACVDMEKHARQWVVQSPRTTQGYRMIAHALIGQERARALVEEALRQRWARLPDVERTSTELVERAQLLAWYGRFDEAAAALAELEKAIEGNANLEPHAHAALLSLELNYERGDDEEVRRIATDYLARKDLWTQNLAIDEMVGFFHHEPRMLAAMLDDTSEAQAEALADWRARMEGSVLNEAARWAFGVASVSHDDERARDAASQFPNAAKGVHVFAWAGRSPVAAAMTGRTLSLAKRSEGVTFLRAAASSCTALTAPFVASRVQLWLAEALHRGDDDRAACEVLAPLLKRWDKARSRTVIAAKRLRNELDC